MNADILVKLNEIIKSRYENYEESSYTCRLFQGGDNRIIKKLGEENAEFIRSVLAGSPEDMAAEAADYIYHLMVALRFRNVDFGMVTEELEKRHVVQQNNK